MSEGDHMTKADAKKAADDLRAIKLVLDALPAEDAREARNKREWSASLDRGIEALSAIST